VLRLEHRVSGHDGTRLLGPAELVERADQRHHRRTGTDRLADRRGDREPGASVPAGGVEIAGPHGDVGADRGVPGLQRLHLTPTVPLRAGQVGGPGQYG
jgi:hypothetical protein